MRRGGKGGGFARGMPRIGPVRAAAVHRYLVREGAAPIRVTRPPCTRSLAPRPTSARRSEA